MIGGSEMKSSPPGTSRAEISWKRLCCIRNFVNDKDRESNIDLPVMLGREGEGIRIAPVCFDPRQQALRTQFLPQDTEHLLLHVHCENHTGITNHLCKFPGKEPRPTAEIKDPVTGFHVPFRKLVRAVEESPQSGIQMCGPF